MGEAAHRSADADLPVGVMRMLLPTRRTVSTFTLPVVTSEVITISASNLSGSASPSCNVRAVMLWPRPDRG